MKRKRYSVEQIIGKLREAEVLLSQGRSVKEVSRELGVTEQTVQRQRKWESRWDIVSRELGTLRLDHE